MATPTDRYQDAVASIYNPTVWAPFSIRHLTENLFMAGLIFRDFENSIANFGDVVNTRKRVDLTARTWTGHAETDVIAHQKITVDLLKAKNISVTLDTMNYTAYLLQDEDKGCSFLDLNNEYVGPAVYPLSEAIDTAIISEILTGTDVDSASVSRGGDGTTDDGTALDEDDLIWARRKLNEQLCPKGGRWIVLSDEHEYDLLKADVLQKANESGSTQALREGNLGRLFGFDLFASQNMPAYTSYPTIGDIPQSICGTRELCALVTRVLPMPGPGAAGATVSMDNVSMRVTMSYDTHYKGTVVSFDTLYGVQLLENAFGYILSP